MTIIKYVFYKIEILIELTGNIKNLFIKENIYANSYY